LLPALYFNHLPAGATGWNPDQSGHAVSVSPLVEVEMFPVIPPKDDPSVIAFGQNDTAKRRARIATIIIGIVGMALAVILEMVVYRV
jgi:hypothetical protein